MEYEKRKVTVDQALYTASDIVHECVAVSDIEWYMKNIRDHDAGLFMHSMRVAFLTAAHCCFTKRTPKETKAAATGALIHDVGKILIPKDILEKPGQLTTEEYKIVKRHPEMGYAYLVTHQSKSKKISDMARKIVLQHHENWDGSGIRRVCVKKKLTSLPVRYISAMFMTHWFRNEHIRRLSRGRKQCISCWKIVEVNFHLYSLNIF